MKHKFLPILSVLLFASLAWGQSGPPLTTTQLILPLETVNITPASQANTAIVGNPGPQTIYYWMVSNFSLGASSPIGPFVVHSAPNTLSGSNYVIFAPIYPAGVASIDLLKTLSPSPPTGVCNCAVHTAVSSGTITDQSNATSSYTVAPINVANYTQTLANEVQGAGSTHLILRQNGAFVADLSTAATGGLPVGCSPGQVPSYNGTTWICSSAGTGTVGGTGSANTFPLWTAPSTLGNSLLTAVTSPNGLNYSLGSGFTWQVDTSDLIWTSSSTMSNATITIANNYDPGGNNDAGGLNFVGGSTTGSACGGNITLEGGQVSGGNGYPFVKINGGCQNGFGQIGTGITLAGGIGAGGVGNGYGIVNIGDYTVGRPGILNLHPSTGNSPIGLLVPSGGASYVLALPPAAPTATNQVLGVSSLSGSNYGLSTYDLSWQTPSGSGTFAGLNTTGANGTNTNATTWTINPSSALGGSTADFTILGAASDTNTASVVDFDTPSGSHQNSFSAGITGVPQIQVCWQAGPEGEVVFGSAVACSAIYTTTFAKTIFQSLTAPHTLVREWQASNVATGDENQWNTASSGTGFNWLTIYDGVTGADTFHTGGTLALGIRGDGQVTASNLIDTALTTAGVATTTSAGLIGSTATVPFLAADTSGSGTAQSATVSPSSWAPVIGSCVSYTTTTANTGVGLTTNINSIGAKSVAIPGASGFTTTLTVGIIPANKPQLMCYDGTNWDDMQTGTSASGGSLSGMTPLGMPIAASATSVTSSTTPGTNQGTYYFGHTNTTQGTNTTPTEIQLGDCSGGGRAISGTSTATIAYSDVQCTVTHARADTTAVTVTIPTPATLNNAAPKFAWENDSNQTDILTPTTYTIALGHAAAASTLNVPSNTYCVASLDPSVSTTWEANCHPNSTSGGSGDTITTPNSTLVVGGTSSATTLDLAGSAGKIMAGATPALTATPGLGTDGSIAGTLQLANSAAAFHTILGSVATANNTVTFFATAPATGDLIDCVTASTTCTLTDAGFLATNVVRKDTTNAGAAAMTLDMHLATSAPSTQLPAVVGGTILAGTSTANLSAPIVFQNTNSTNNNTSITMGITAPGTSTGQSVLNVNGASTGGDLQDWGTGGTWASGVLSGQTIVASILPGGAFQSKGTTAGFVDLAQGTTSASVAPCNTANSHCIQAGAAVTAGVETDAPALAQGIPTRSGTSSAVTDGYSGDANHSATVSWSTATSVGSTSLCSSANCPVGTYRVSAYIDVTTACTTTGSYLVNVIYTDDTTVSKTAFIPLEGTGTTFATGVIVPISTTDFGTGSFILRSTGATSINYSTTAAPCGSGGPGVGKLYLTVEPIQ